MPPVAGAALRQNLAVVYRPPDFAPVAKEILEIRTKLMDTLIPAGPRAAMTVRQVLHRGMSLGMLIDQHFARGTDAIFFGRRCKVNPTVARFARQLDCAIHGARAIRLPGGRFQIELTDALALPRDGTGKIEIAGTMQMLTSVIEGWIREHPEQWLWTHRRWR
jgi:KDO2-lipid IV(A) lauroyltransferase